MRAGTFCLVIQKKSFKELVLDGNLISGGIGEDVFVADIIQAWQRDRDGKLTKEGGRVGLKRNSISGPCPGGDNPGTTALSIYTPSQQIQGQQKGTGILSLRHTRPLTDGHHSDAHNSPGMA